MRSKPAPKSLLSLVPLEDRLTPTTGIPWLDSSSLTISFAPDGTNVSGKSSDLFDQLKDIPTATWQKEILRAVQTWASVANINVGLMADGGQAFGTAGAPQEDTRFGDIRVGGRQLSNDLKDSMAGSVGFSHAGGTWSGDILLNDRFKFGIGATSNQGDLYTVALQETGNALSLLDNPADPTAAMYPKYQNVARTGLAASDVTAIRNLYGARKADVYEGTGGNETVATAYSLGSVTALSGDITQAGDVDYYKFTAPAVTSLITKASVELKAKGLSLFTGKVTVTNAGGTVVGTGTVTDPTANDLSVPISGYTPGATYTIRVEGADTSVFSVGAYNLNIAFDRLLSGAVSKVSTLMPYVNYEGWGNNGTLSAAQGLTPLSSGNLSTFAVGGLLTGANDVDWFKFTPQAGGTLTASVWAIGTSGLVPTMRVYDAAGTEVSTSVVCNGGGLYTLESPLRPTGGTYYVKVSAASSSGSQNVGLYVFGTNQGSYLPTMYDDLSTGSLTGAQSVAYSTMTVGEARLTQFALSSFAGVGVDAAVRMTIFDNQGNQVFTLASISGQPLTTGAVWLASGTYTVVYNAGTKTGTPLLNLSYVVRKWERSSPIDPYPTDPTSPPPPPPPGGGQVGTSPPTTTPPPSTQPVGPVSPAYPT